MTVDAASVIVDLLKRGHAVEFRAQGDSMHPVIRSEDVLHVEARQDVRVGDVVLTLAERGLTAHRVLRVYEDSIVTRGDNAPAEDQPVRRTQVLGRVTRIIRAGRPMRVRAKSRLRHALRRLRNQLRA